MNTHKIVVLIIITIIILTTNNQLKASKNKYLVDSISTLLNTPQPDSILFDNIFEFIRKNRQNLGSDYLPLLHTYAKKSELCGYKKGLMQSFDIIGLQYRYDENYDSALFYHNQSLKMALLYNDINQQYYNYNNLAQVYRMQDLSVQAIFYFHKALKIAEALGNQKYASRTMNTLGATYVVQKDYNQAMHYFRESAKIAKKRNDKRTVAYNYGSIGEVFLFQNQNDSAMYYFVASKNILVELGSERGMAVAEHLIGQAHFALNNFNAAEFYFSKGLAMHLKEDNTRYQALCYAYLGKIKMKQNKPDSAEYYLLKAENIAKSIHSFENLILVFESFFDLYKNTQNWEKAIYSLQTSQNYKDSIISISNAKEIQSIEIAYETNRKEQTIKLLSAENEIKNQRINMGLILIGLLVLSIIMVIYLQAMRKKQTQLSYDKLKQQLMLSQMNPHFIFNALASIQSYMYKNDAKKAAAYMGNFAALSRSILNNSSAESIPLEEEIETLRNYIELEKMRMNNNFDYNIILPDEIDAEFIHIPPMLLQPFVENALKHGLKDCNLPGKLTLVFTELNNLISAEITDNGIGIYKALDQKNSNHKSKATEIFKQRMKILQRKYPNIPEPQIVDLTNSETKQSGTKILVFMPIIN